MKFCLRSSVDQSVPRDAISFSIARMLSLAFSWLRPLNFANNPWPADAILSTIPPRWYVQLDPSLIPGPGNKLCNIFDIWEQVFLAHLLIARKLPLHFEKDRKYEIPWTRVPYPYALTINYQSGLNNWYYSWIRRCQPNWRRILHSTLIPGVLQSEIRPVSPFQLQV